MISPRHNLTSGFTLIEVLVYVMILTLVSISTVTFLISLSDLYQLYRAEKVLFDSSQLVLERIGTEVRNADSVNTGASTLQDPASVLALTRGADTVSFALNGGALEVSRNGTSEGLLTTGEVTVDEFYAYQYLTPDTELVRVRVVFTADTGEHAITREFDSALNLRGSYVE